jgi:hypothetical protein
MECTFGQFFFIFFATLSANIVTIIIILFIGKWIYNNVKAALTPIYNKMKESKLEK